MRISDWSSDVCSSDLVLLLAGCGGLPLAVLALGREVFLVLLDVVMRIVTVGVAVAVVGMVIVPAGIAVAGRLLVAIVVLVVAETARPPARSEEHTSELQSQMRSSYDVVCFNKTKDKKQIQTDQKYNK